MLTDAPPPPAAPAAESLPQQPQLEWQVLSAACVYPEEVMRHGFEHGLHAEHFYVPAHRKLWELLAQRYEEGLSAELPLISHAIEQAGLLESLGGYAGVAELFGATSLSLLGLTECIQKLEDARYRRQLALAARRLAQEAAAPASDAATLSAGCDRVLSLQGEADGARALRCHSLHTLVNSAAKSLQDIILNGTHVEGVRTGLAPLDEALGGLRAGGGYYLMGARPGVGKTALGLNIASYVAAESLAQAQQPEGGEPPARVLYVTAEMSEASLTRRLLLSTAQMSLRELCQAKGDPEKTRRLSARCAWAKRLPIHVIDTRGSSAEAVAAYVRRQCRAQRVCLVVVDYLQLLRSEHETLSRTDELERVSGAFRELAKAIPAPILALAQINRTVERTADKRPCMADVKGSGAFEQDAEAVMLLHRPELYATTDEERARLRGQAELILCKNRNGATADIALTWDGKRQQYNA